MLPADQAGIPPCEGPRARSAPISFAIPKGAWDTHLHVFGPTAVFPYAESVRILRRIHRLKIIWR